MISRFAQSLVLFVLVTASARAQASSQPSETHGFWVELGAGVGKSSSAQGNAALSADMSLQRGHQLWSVRGDAVSTSWSSGVAQVGLLFGRASVIPKGRFGGVSAGIAFVQSATCIRNCGLLSSGPATHETRDGVGVSAAATGAIRTGTRGGVGIGITAFGNVNSLSSFVGINVGISGGRW
jgi:hypothetical protein